MLTCVASSKRHVELPLPCFLVFRLVLLIAFAVSLSYPLPSLLPAAADYPATAAHLSEGNLVGKNIVEHPGKYNYAHAQARARARTRGNF